MRRREMLSAIAGATTLVSPGSSRAQQQPKQRLGILLYSRPQGDPSLASFLEALGTLGYRDGENITIDYRFAEGRPERLRGLAAQLAGLKPDLLFALGGDVTLPAVQATNTVPILFVSSADPVQLGVVDSLARPGRNATGISLLLDELASKRLALLKEAAPTVTRTAFVWNPDHPDNELELARRAATKLGLTLHPLSMRSPDELEGVLRQARDQGAEALYVVSSRQTVQSLPRFVAFATDIQIPLAGGWGPWAHAGGLLAYGPNSKGMIRRAAEYADRLLRGSRAADLPVQQPTEFELVLNLRTARALGLTISPTLLARAHEVLE